MPAGATDTTHTASLEYLEHVEETNRPARPGGVAEALTLAGGARARGLVRAGRRAWPVVLMAWERWQALSPEDKERYKRQAHDYVERGRAVAQGLAGR